MEYARAVRSTQMEGGHGGRVTNIHCRHLRKRMGRICEGRDAERLSCAVYSAEKTDSSSAQELSVIFEEKLRYSLS